MINIMLYKPLEALELLIIKNRQKQDKKGIYWELIGSWLTAIVRKKIKKTGRLGLIKSGSRVIRLRPNEERASQ